MGSLVGSTRKNEMGPRLPEEREEAGFVGARQLCSRPWILSPTVDHLLVAPAQRLLAVVHVF